MAYYFYLNFITGHFLKKEKVTVPRHQRHVLQLICLLSFSSPPKLIILARWLTHYCILFPGVYAKTKLFDQYIRRCIWRRPMSWCCQDFIHWDEMLSIIIHRLVTNVMMTCSKTYFNPIASSSISSCKLTRLVVLFWRGVHMWLKLL